MLFRSALRQLSSRDGHTVGVVRLSSSRDPRSAALAGLPADILAILVKEPESRTAAEAVRLADHHRRFVAAETAGSRADKQRIDAALAAIKPATVPVMQELAALMSPGGMAPRSADPAVQDLRDKLEANGVELAAPADKPVTPEQFAKLLDDDIVKWARIVKTSGATVD